MSSVDEILTFGTGGRLNLAEALKQTQVKKEEKKPKSKKWSSSTQSDSGSCDEDDRKTVQKRRRKRRRGDHGSVAARLKQRAAALEQALDDTPSPGCKEDGCESTEEMKEEKDLSPPPSPLPSPPPLLFTSEAKQSQALLKADQLLQELKQPQEHASLLSESFLDSSSVLEISGLGTPSTTRSNQTLTVRVRCRGKIHRFTVNKEDPLVLICVDLGKELGVKSEQILLSHRTTTLNSTSSPATLGLSTVDIIDAVVLQEGQLRNREVDAPNISLDPDESVTVKVQTNKKSIVYSLAKTDTLSKVMTAFAAILEVPVNQLQFTFDGDPISADQTPSDLDMDDDDIIDARLLN